MKENGTLETLNGAYIQPRIDAQNEVINNFKTQTSNSIATQNQLITNLQNSTISALSNMSAEIHDLRSASPLVHHQHSKDKNIKNLC